MALRIDLYNRKTSPNFFFDKGNAYCIITLVKPNIKGPLCKRKEIFESHSEVIKYLHFGIVGWMGCYPKAMVFDNKLSYNTKWDFKLRHDFNTSSYRMAEPASCYRTAAGSIPLHFEVSLGKILTTKLLLMCCGHLAWQPLPSVYECMYELLSVALDKNIC